MPIARRNFDLGILPDVERWIVRVYDFLAPRAGDAFAHWELYQVLTGTPDNVMGGPESNMYEAALAELENRSAITPGLVDGKRYYAFHRSMNTETWEPA